MKFRFPSWKFNATALTAWVALWCLLALNVPFWSKVLQVRPLASIEDGLYLGSFALLAFLAINLFLMPLTLVRPIVKPLLALVVLLAGFASYFVSSYGILIDKVMIRNVFETNGTEAGELINFNLILYVGLLGVLPAFLVMRAGVIAVGFRRELAHRGIAQQS
jgi:lipid A ethanolaminephosphotransferase